MNVKLLAVAVVAIVCVSAVGLYFVTVDNGDEEGPIQIVDGSGKTITLNEPLTEVIIVNTNAAIAMRILGLSNEVVGLSFSTTSNDANFIKYSPLFPNAQKLVTYNSISAEEIASLCKYVICPVKSMTLNEDREAACENLGVTVIRLEFNGETTLEDYEKLAILFGKTENVMNAYNAYLKTYNSVVNKVIAASAGSIGDKTFLYLMSASGGGSFYNQTSAGSIMAESVCGQNALRGINGLDLDKISNIANQDGIKEAIIAMNDSNKIDKIFIRGTSTIGPKEIWGSSNCALSGTGYANLIGSESSGIIYTFESELMSGSLAYVGYVLIAEACGVDTGYDVSDLVKTYNATYGFDIKTTEYLYQIVIAGGTSTAVEVVIS